ncbi:MAG: oxidoreductase, partial [Acidobacteriota bacterium]|nr:oxidoreductase [Acidobacteriota bacterium]
IGAFGDWTLVIARTELGRSLLQSMVDAGVVETRPGDDDPGAVALLHRLAQVSRKRWPVDAVPGPRRLPVTNG